MYKIEVSDVFRFLLAICQLCSVISHDNDNRYDNDLYTIKILIMERYTEEQLIVYIVKPYYQNSSSVINSSQKTAAHYIVTRPLTEWKQFECLFRRYDVPTNAYK